MPGSSFRKLCSFMVGAAVIACAVQAATPAETQKARHEHYEELGDAFKAVRDQSNAGSPDFAAMQKAANTVQKASVNQLQWFPKGTGPEAGKTRALPEIWTNTADFTAAMKLFEDRAPALVDGRASQGRRRGEEGVSRTRRRLQELPRQIPRA